MRAMPRTPSPSDRLAGLMDDRRIDLRLNWTEVAERGDTTTESILAIRKGKKVRRSTYADAERGLGWKRGSIEAILAGGDPTPEPERTPEQRLDKRAHAAGAPPGTDAISAALAAIDAIPDSELVPEGKEHLKNQLGLLLRIRAATAAAAAVDVFDEERERRIAARAKEIRNERALTKDQKATAIDEMEAYERSRAAVPVADGWRNPHLDVRFEESDDEGLSEAEAEAALAEESAECTPKR